VDASVTGRVSAVVRETGDRWFFERRGAQDNQFKLYLRQGLAGAERLLVDPEAMEKATGKPHAINYHRPAPGGRLLAYGVSQQGSEEAVLHLLDTRSGKAVGEPIDRVNWGILGWSPRGDALLFNRLQALKPGMAETEKYQNSRVWLLRPGAAVETAKAVFGPGLPGVTMSPAELPAVSITHDGRWALGLAINGTQRELGLYLSPAADLLAGRPRWRQLFDARAEITGVSYQRNTLYLLSHQGASRSQVLSLDLARPDLAAAKVIVPASERVVTGIATAADALYIELRDGNVKRLFKRAHRAEAPVVEVPLPLAGSFQLNDDEGGPSGADPRLPGVVIDLQGWTQARQIYQVGADGRVRNTGLQPSGPYDELKDVETREVLVRSHDGAMVPMSVILRRGTVLDGSHPTLIYGYASYGVTEEPFYSISRAAWLDAGGVLAVINPRGSSVYGEDWYRAGFQTTKPNTWKDTIACAEWLIAQGYTRPAKLGIWGGSAGGILVGRAITERPDLFAAAVPMVGALDMVRAEVTPNGVPNIPEFGTRITESGFRALLAMSTYHQIRDGVKYPAVLLTHGVNDPRVEVWHSSKTAARLLAASTSGRPVLLRLDWDSGHGIGNTKRQMWEERADVFSFLLWQMGEPGFQPAP
jgi:prolyl oligopeptidase